MLLLRFTGSHDWHGTAFVYRTIGGMLDIYFFPGPSPEDVVNQYLALIGTPMLPAYWALGFQLCRYGYHSLGDIEAAVNRTMAAGISIGCRLRGH